MWGDDSGWFPQNMNIESDRVWCLCKKRPAGNLSQTANHVVILTLSGVAIFQRILVALPCKPVGCKRKYWERTVNMNEESAFQATWSEASLNVYYRRISMKATNIWNCTWERGWRKVRAQLSSWICELTQASLLDAISKRLRTHRLRGVLQSSSSSRISLCSLGCS